MGVGVDRGAVAVAGGGVAVAGLGVCVGGAGVWVGHDETVGVGGWVNVGVGVATSSTGMPMHSPA